MPRFVDLQSEEELARAVGVPASRIVEYAKAADQTAYYQLIKIPKRGYKRRGQFREVYKAKHQWVTQVHYMVARLVVEHTAFPEYVQGFVQKRSILSNARQHLGSRIVLHADVAGFFDAITVEQVKQGFASLGSTPRMAELLASACTIAGRLRQGTRCAPALANLVCRQLDVDMVTLATALGARYTRYADDLTFSGETVPSSEQVRGILQRHGFELRDDRCYSQHRGHCQYVTGLTVNHPERPRLPRRMKRNMRLVLYYVEKYGIDDHLQRVGWTRPFGSRWAIEGALRFFHAIEPELTARLRERFETGVAKSEQEQP
jgi:Reverse transcriptase (RNA-dependent DNA polymerase)